MTTSRKVALVTGGTRGIGRAISLELAKRGYFVAMNFHHHRDRAEMTLQEVREIGGDGDLFQADVTQPEQVKEMVRAIHKRFRRIDLLVNNAGVTRDHVLMMLSATMWNDVLSTNLDSVYRCCKEVIRTMIAQKSGVIVNIGSGSGISPRIGQTNYSASKSGLIGLTRSLAREVAGYGVRVVVVAPGFTKTEMADSIATSAVEESLKMIPMARWGLPEEIAKVVGFVASDDASYLTGVTLVVDGGRAGVEQDFGILPSLL